MSVWLLIEIRICAKAVEKSGVLKGFRQKDPLFFPVAFMELYL
jgi:hypothetical protein